jgi:hypothetical protein
MSISTAVAEADERALVFRFVARRRELEAEFEVRRGVVARSSDMRRVRNDVRALLQEHGSLRVEVVGVPTHFVHRPVHDIVAAGDQFGIRRRLETNLRPVDQVMPHEAATHRLPILVVHVDVVDFLDFDGRDIAIRVHRDLNRCNFTPPVRSVTLDLDIRGLDDQVRGADAPHRVVRILLGGGMSAGLPRARASVGPLGNLGELELAQGWIVLVLLDADGSSPCTTAA